MTWKANAWKPITVCALPEFRLESPRLFPAFGSSHSRSRWSKWRDCRAAQTYLVKLIFDQCLWNCGWGPAVIGNIGGRTKELEGRVVGFESFCLPDFVQVLPQVGCKSFRLHHVLLRQLVLLYQAHVVLVRELATSNEPSAGSAKKMVKERAHKKERKYSLNK